MTLVLVFFCSDIWVKSEPNLVCLSENMNKTHICWHAKSDVLLYWLSGLVGLYLIMIKRLLYEYIKQKSSHVRTLLCDSGAPKNHCWQVKWSCRGEKGDFRIGAHLEQSCLLFPFIIDSPITDDLPHGINCGDSFLTSFWQCKHTFQSYLNI